MTVTRQATVIWEGDLASGQGEIKSATRGILENLPASWASRTEDPPNKRTSPEELIAAAHASCFCMALSAGLGQSGTPPQELSVTATVTFSKLEVGWRIISSALQVAGQIRGIGTEGLRQAADAAKNGFPSLAGAHWKRYPTADTLLE